MQFISEKVIDGSREVFTAPFDTSFIKNVEISDSDTLTFDYEIYNFKACFPMNVSTACINVRPTNEQIYSWATIYINDDNAPLLDKYVNNWGDVECDIKMSEAENKSLTLFLLRHLMEQKSHGFGMWCTTEKSNESSPLPG